VLIDGIEVADPDDEEARRRLVGAAAYCVVRGGTGRISMDEVADEAGVSRATVYRYYRRREDLILEVMLSRLDQAMELIVASLEEPSNAARSITDLILASVGLVRGDRVSEALFSPDSRSIVAAVESTAEPIVDGLDRHIGPLLRQWQADGQLAADLDLRLTVRWLNAVSAAMMTPPWLELTEAEKRDFLDRYVVACVLA
jgi:TetR/AcrR family transcriptional regulator